MRIDRREPKIRSLKEPSTLAPAERPLAKQWHACMPETLLERRPLSLPV